jgi:hypothetical protein
MAAASNLAIWSGGEFPIDGSEIGALQILSKKIFFDLCKKHRLSQRAKSPVFIERNPAFFTKIHEKNKSCQSHHALEIRGAIVL